MTVLATGCKVDLDIEQTTEPEAIVTPLVPMTFQAGGEATKSAIDGTSILWAPGDAITVFGSDNTPYQSKELTSGGASATFSVELPEGTTDPYAVYPANASASISDGTITTTIPSEQILADGTTVAPGALVAVAKASGHKFAFKNAFSLVVVTPTIDGVTEISVSAASGSLAGDFAITVSDQPSASPAGNNVSTVTLKPFGDGTFTKETAYYVAVAPGAVSDLTIRFKTADVSDKAFKLGRIASGEVTLERNAGIELTSSPVVIIDSKAALDDWAAFNDRNSYAAALYADIDYEGSNWTPVDFENDFNGLGHKIYNIKIDNSSTTNVGFFGTLSGNLSKVVFGSSDGINADGKSQITINASSSTSTHRVGIVANTGAVEASIKRVDNFIPISVSESFTGDIRAGGVLGDMSVSGSRFNMEYCNNMANMTIKAFKNGSSIGGIYGRSNKSVSVSNCTNTGNLIITNSLSITLETFIGGIVGYHNSATWANNVNKGTITVNSTANQLKIGGLAGRLANSTISDCTNNGAVSFAGEHTSNGNVYIGGLIGCLQDASNIKGCINNGDVNCSYDNGVHNVGGIVGWMNHANAVVTQSSESGKPDLRTINNGKIWTAETTSNSNHRWYGGIVGYMQNGSVSEVLNTGEVSPAVNTTGICAAGGIAGRIAACSQLSGCTNGSSDKTDGNVSISNKANGRTFASGIMAYTDGAATNLSSYVNYGSVSATNATWNGSTPDYFAAAGIVAYAADTISIIDDCTNYGNISCDHYVGAIMGMGWQSITSAKIARQGLINGVAPTTQYPRASGYINAKYSISYTIID